MNKRGGIKIGIPSGTKEWADYNVNCINGCFYNCKYCYAKFMAIRFGRKNHKNWSIMEINDKVVSKNYRLRKGRFMFPTTHDIFPFEPFLSACLKTLENILMEGNEILITSKPSILVIKKICREFSKFKHQIQFRFTIGSINNNLLRFWEPKAPSYSERKKSLILAYENGFKTSISSEPLLDFDPRPLINDLYQYVTESFWLGIMNYIPVKNVHIEEQMFYNNARKLKRKENLMNILRWTKNYNKIRYKDSIKKRLKLISNY